MSVKRWYRSDDEIFTKLGPIEEDMIAEICKFSNWLLRKKICSGISFEELRQVMDSVIVIALRSPDFEIINIQKHFRKHFKELYHRDFISIEVLSSFERKRELDMEIDVGNAIKKLDKMDQEIIAMHIVEEKTAQEIADILDVARITIFKHIVAIKAFLKIELSKGGYCGG